MTLIDPDLWLTSPPLFICAYPHCNPFKFAQQAKNLACQGDHERRKNEEKGTDITDRKIAPEKLWGQETLAPNGGSTSPRVFSIRVNSCYSWAKVL